jgi:hypothetical protein
MRLVRGLSYSGALATLALLLSWASAAAASPKVVWIASHGFVDAHVLTTAHIMRRAPKRTLRLGLVSILCAGLSIAACASIASARSNPVNSPVVLHPKWRLVSRSTYGYVEASGPYVLLDSGQQNSVGPVIDNQTGTRTQAPLPCTTGFDGQLFLQLADPWLLYACGSQQQPDVRLYSLTQQSWLDVPTPQLVAQSLPNCSNLEDYPCFLTVTAGRYWLGWSFSCTRCDHASYPQGFSNIQTGAWRSSAPLSGTYDDPNAKNLSVKVCRPLHVAPGGSLIQLGRFRLIAAVNRPSYLVRCGSDFRRRVDPYASDSQMVSVNQNGTKADELLLPSLRPFQITIPRQPSLGPDVSLTLSDHTLYASLPPRVWTTPEAPILREAQRKTKR